MMGLRRGRWDLPIPVYVYRGARFHSTVPGLVLCHGPERGVTAPVTGPSCALSPPVPAPLAGGYPRAPSACGRARPDSFEQRTRGSPAGRCGRSRRLAARAEPGCTAPGLTVPIPSGAGNKRKGQAGAGGSGTDRSGTEGSGRVFPGGAALRGCTGPARYRSAGPGHGGGRRAALRGRGRGHGGRREAGAAGRVPGRAGALPRPRPQRQGAGELLAGRAPAIGEALRGAGTR